MPPPGCGYQKEERRRVEIFIVAIGIESLVVTLGMGTLLAGVALGIQSLPVSGVSASLVDVGRTELFGLQLIGLSGWIEQVFYGTALILAIALAGRIAGKRDRPTWLSRTARIRPNTPVTPTKGESAA